MSQLETINGKTTNINTNTQLINNYKYLNEEKRKKLEEQLINIYNLNSSINYTNPSYVFPHQLILDKLEKYVKIKKLYDFYRSNFLDYGKEKLLLIDLEKINEELSIHYNVLNKLEEEHPETFEIIENEKNKIKEVFQSNTNIINELREHIELNNYIEPKLKEKELEYEKLKDQTNKLINKNEQLFDVEETTKSKYKYIELIYKLELFFYSKEGEEYISNIVKEMENIKVNYLKDDNYNPIQDINRIIKEVEFIDNYSDKELSKTYDYERLLDIKYWYLKKHPNEEEIHNLKNDYKSFHIYHSFIINDLYRKYIKNEIDDRFYKIMSSISTIDILCEMNPFILTLFFAYYSNTLEEWFQNNIENSNNIFKYLNMDNSKIIISSDMSRETYFYLPNHNSISIELINIHQELIKNKGLSWPILKGIKEITLTDNESSKNILSLFSLDQYITISKDVEALTLENLKDIKSGNIIFQDGIEKINMKNVSFKDEISITIPKSVKYLDIDIESSNINTLVFEDYDQSNLLNNPYFFNYIIRQIYNVKSNFSFINTDYEFAVSPKSNKTIILVFKRENEIKEYNFRPIYISSNKTYDYDNIEQWKQDLIDMVRKKVYEDIIRTLNTKDTNIITNNYDIIDINKRGWDRLIKSNKPFSNIVLPKYGPFLKRNEEELRLMDEIVGAKVLDLGCGAGDSLEYLYENGAKEIWGVDISNEQIERAKKRFPYNKGHFFNSPMEEEIPIPNNYFDYIISICSIGYTSDIKKTFQNVYKYLNDTGAFIVSWTHPVYNCLGMDNDKVLFNKSYFDESAKIITKGPDKIYLVQKNLMISTIINTAISSGLYVDKLLEETVKIDDVDGYNSDYYRKEKTDNCPTTLIYRLKKIKNEEK